MADFAMLKNPVLTLSIRASLNRLLNPRSVAIVGASEKPATVGGGVLANLDRAAFKGPIHLVSRTRDRIGDRVCVPSIVDLPLGVDAVVLAMPAEAVIEAVQLCVQRNVGGVVIFSSGFGEGGPAGVERQRMLSRIATDAGLAVLGPNCVGFTNYRVGVPLTFSDFTPRELASRKRAGILAQSGAILAAIDEGLNAKGIATTFAISTGNEAVLGVEDCLDELIDDPSIDVITVFAEQIRKAAKFVELADRAHQAGKPIVLMHPGRTQRARASAESHTGAMAGNHAAMCAVLLAHGVRIVDTLDELLDVTVLSAHWPRARGRGVMVLTNSGALRSVALDFADSIGLELPLLAEETRSSLSRLLPPTADIDNPLDLLTTGLSNPDVYGQASEILLRDLSAGGLVFASSPGPAPVQASKARNMLPLMQRSDKPIAFVMQSDEAALAPQFVEMAREAGMPVFRSMDRALRALARMTAAGPLSGTGQVRRVGETIEVPPFDGPISEYRSKALLAKAGLSMPAGQLARSIGEAVTAAERIGFPVVLKAQAAMLTHKSDVGGVALGLADADSVRAAWRRMHDDIVRFSPNTILEGVLVEAMSARGVEMIVGARRDPDWGPIVLVGLGGVTAEAIKDVRVMAGGLSRDAIRQEIRMLRGASLLRGFRGAPACDEAALLDVIIRIGDIMITTPAISVIEINPLMVLAEGQGTRALDALVIFDSTSLTKAH